MRGLGMAWLGIVLAISFCILLSIRWSAPAGGRAPLLTQIAANVPQTPGLTASPVPVTPTDLPTPDSQATVDVLPTVPPETMGYGIQVAFASPESLDVVQSMGLGWVNYEVRWAEIEPEPGVYHWEDLDQAMAEASTRSLHVLLTVKAAPGWARTISVRGKDGPPDDPQTFVTFLSLLASRYKGSVQALQLWDEQNQNQEWYTTAGLNAADYLRLITPGVQVIRQIDPTIIIISGAPVPTGLDDGIVAVDDFRYMQEMISGGLLDIVDCVGTRHQGFNLPPTLSAEDALAAGAPPGTVYLGPFDSSNPANPHHSWSFYSTLSGYQSMIVAAGRDTPLCVTSFGWASAQGMFEPSAEYAFAKDNTGQEQADYLVSAFQQMHDSGYVRLAIVFNLDFAAQQSETRPVDEGLFSLLTRFLLPRPAIEALKAMPKN
jgi:hypothetical protein